MFHRSWIMKMLLRLSILALAVFLPGHCLAQAEEWPTDDFAFHKLLTLVHSEDIKPRWVHQVGTLLSMRVWSPESRFAAGRRVVKTRREFLGEILQFENLKGSKNSLITLELNVSVTRPVRIHNPTAKRFTARVTMKLNVHCKDVSGGDITRTEEEQGDSEDAAVLAALLNTTANMAMDMSWTRCSHAR